MFESSPTESIELPENHIDQAAERLAKEHDESRKNDINSLAAVLKAFQRPEIKITEEN
jgi:hypothetical protein